MAVLCRKAVLADLHSIVELLMDDELGKSREDNTNIKKYEQVFNLIDRDPNQYLMVVEGEGALIGTCHLTLMPSLSFQGSIRLNIEAVRIAADYRSKGIGAWMITQAIEYGRKNGASFIQLATNKKREKAKKFYEKLGFEATHEGMKLYL
jgi:ribosomal protein S18 acetylase RimI-like enzyme